MRHSSFVITVLLSLVGLTVSPGFSPSSSPTTRPNTRSAAVRTDPVASYAGLPLSFAPNLGQVGPDVDFVARGPGYEVALTSTAAHIAFPGSHPARHSVDAPTDVRTVSRIGLTFVGASRVKAVALDELPGRVNVIRGNDPSRWRVGIPTYAKVAYSGVYPGVDLVYYGNRRQLEYDVVLGAAIDPGDIQIRFEGASAVDITATGALVLRVGDQDFVQAPPIAYQRDGAERHSVRAAYVMTPDGNGVGFELGAHDLTLPVVIDPVLAYSTYLGGTGDDEGRGIIVDASGDAYIVGNTISTNFPTFAAAQPSNRGDSDAFIAKLNPLGNALLYSTYLGGADDDVGFAVALDASGAVYAAGYTQSADFPSLSAYQPVFGGVRDCFVAKLNTAGTLASSTYLGGTNEDSCFAIAVDAGGSAFVAGATSSATFPVTLGAFQTAPAALDAFVTKFAPTMSSLLYSSRFGGSADEEARALRIDTAGNAYVTGLTFSTNFPVLLATQPTNAGGEDGFVAKLNALGAALVFSTYLGGSGNDAPFALDIDASSAVYVAGVTDSADFPTQLPYQASRNGPRDAFVTKIAPTGNALLFSTYLGGSGEDDAEGVAVDAAHNVYVAGSTRSSDFPTLAAFQPTSGGQLDAFVTELSALGNTLVYSTYLGGATEDGVDALAIDASGNAYITGFTESPNFPTTLGAFQSSRAAKFDAFVAKLGVLPSTAVCSVAVNEGGWITAANGDMATFNGVVQTDPQGNPSGHENYHDHGLVQPMTVASISILAVTCSDDRTTASVFGTATIDGLGTHAFRVDMVDRSQSGQADEYGITLDNGYASGLQPVSGGNVNIH